MSELPMREPTFLILTALAAPQHGYGIMRDVSQISAGRVRRRAATLYEALNRLASDRLVEFDREEIVDARLRRYYRPSPEGGRRLQDEVDRRRSTTELADSHGTCREAIWNPSCSPARAACDYRPWSSIPAPDPRGPRLATKSRWCAAGYTSANLRAYALFGEPRERRQTVSRSTELVIFFAVLAAGWTIRVVRQVLRHRRKPSLPGTADAYEGNLVVPAIGSRRHGIFTRHGFTTHSTGHDSGIGGHEGSHRAPGGFNGHGPFDGTGHAHH
jgi:DNA-binding PadR family transcriptional regulator